MTRCFIKKYTIYLLSLGIVSLWTVPAKAGDDLYFDVTCISSINYFSLKSVRVSDSDNLKDQKSAFSNFFVYRSLATKKNDCKLKNHAVSLGLDYHNPLNQMDWGQLSVFLDNKLVEKFVVGNKGPTSEFFLSLQTIESIPVGRYSYLSGKVCDLTSVNCTNFDYNSIPVRLLPDF